MNRLLILACLITVSTAAEQTAITDNGIEIILKEDNTWVPIDSITGSISPFATAGDSQTVYLKEDSTWKYLEATNTLPNIPNVTDKNGLKITIIPYQRLEKKPEPIEMPIPEYPDPARKAGIEGVAVVKVLVNIDGIVDDAEILKSSGNELLDESALKAARQAEFTPAEHNGKPVRLWTSIPIRFQLLNKPE